MSTPGHRRPFCLILVILTTGAACTTFKRWDYEGWGRDQWQHPQQVVESLWIQAGDRVADVGSGIGYFTFRFTDPAGPEHLVFAVDIDAGMNGYIKQESRLRGLSNV